MENLIRSFFLTVFIFLLIAPAGASGALSLPEPTGFRMNDFVGVLRNQESRTKIENALIDFEKKTNHQAVIVILNSLEGEPVESVANKLFEKWKIGDRTRNDGILLLVSTEDRSVRIEVGYGLESILTDARAKQIISQDLIPFFKQNQYSTAFLLFHDRLHDLLMPENKKQSTLLSPSSVTRSLFFLLLFLAMPFLILLLRKRVTSGGIYGYERTYRSNGVFRDSSPWFGGGGGFGGGGFMGGGGLSGGGGASGRW